MTWTAVEEVLDQAHSIAWDGCHKIYVLLDEEQTALMESYGYREDDSQMYLASEFASTDDLYAWLQNWWDESCGLRFISAVRTDEEDPNAGFTQLIAQFEDEDAETA